MQKESLDRVNHIQLLLISPSIGTDGWKILSCFDNVPAWGYRRGLGHCWEIQQRWRLVSLFEGDATSFRGGWRHFRSWEGCHGNKNQQLDFLWMKMMKCRFIDFWLLWTSRLRLGNLGTVVWFLRTLRTGKSPFLGESVSHLDGPWLSKVWSCTWILRISQSETQAPQ